MFLIMTYHLSVTQILNNNACELIGRTIWTGNRPPHRFESWSSSNNYVWKKLLLLQPSQGLMPASFKVRTIPLDGDGSAIGHASVLCSDT